MVVLGLSLILLISRVVAQVLQNRIQTVLRKNKSGRWHPICGNLVSIWASHPCNQPKYARTTCHCALEKCKDHLVDFFTHCCIYVYRIENIWQGFYLFRQVEPEKGLYYWDEVDHRLLDQVSCSFVSLQFLVAFVPYCNYQAELNMGIGLRVYTGPDTPAWVYAEGVFCILLHDHDYLRKQRCQKSDWTAQIQMSTRTTVGTMQASHITQIQSIRYTYDFTK